MDSHARNFELGDTSRRRLPTIPQLRVAGATAVQHANDEYVGIFQQLVDGLQEQAALVDAESGAILAVNGAWQQAATLNGFADFRPGENYYRELSKVSASGYGPGQAAHDAIHEIRRGKRRSARMVYDGTGLQEGKKFEARLGSMEVGGRKYIRVTRYDITELARLRTMRNEFSGALMRVQEDERRRMGRELHDSGMQVLAALGISLAQLRRDQSPESVWAVTANMEDLLLRAQKEFRSISFLAHPPQLEEGGLVVALQALVDGFGLRAGLVVAFHSEGIAEGMTADAEHVIYRVAQEALSNAHRHAAASTLDVRLVARKRSLHLVIADNGRGIPEDLRPGVGLQSMRERLQEIGGRLAIRNGRPGTVILASLPLPVREPAPAG